MKGVIESLKPEKEHILKANDMADAIFKEDNKFHKEMVEKIKSRLAELHDIISDTIKKC